ncbi:hypothetical protein, partial [Flexivirga caeni]|uniref:hypothetical protein n=1 Tax=Flexivirga caeni TaxID=2294115 RepID=UPI001C65A6CD
MKRKLHRVRTSEVLAEFDGNLARIATFKTNGDTSEEFATLVKRIKTVLADAAMSSSRPVSVDGMALAAYMIARVDPEWYRSDGSRVIDALRSTIET